MCFPLKRKPLLLVFTFKYCLRNTARRTIDCFPLALFIKFNRFQQQSRGQCLPFEHFCLFSLRSHVSGNMTMIKLQKQLAERSNAITELEGRFLQLQEVCFFSRLKSWSKTNSQTNNTGTHQLLFPLSSGLQLLEKLGCSKVRCVYHRYKLGNKQV